MAFYAFTHEPPPPRTTIPPPDASDASDDEWWFTPQGQVVMEVLWEFSDARKEVVARLQRLHEGTPAAPLTDPQESA